VKYLRLTEQSPPRYEHDKAQANCKPNCESKTVGKDWRELYMYLGIRKRFS